MEDDRGGVGRNEVETLQNKCCRASRSGVESSRGRSGRSFAGGAGRVVGLKPNLEGGGRCATEFGRWKADGGEGCWCGAVGTVAIKVRQSLIRADQGEAKHNKAAQQRTAKFDAMQCNEDRSDRE
jgi:hypothetical protein